MLRISSWPATSGKFCRAKAFAMLCSSVHCIASAMANTPRQLAAVSCFSARDAHVHTWAGKQTSNALTMRGVAVEKASVISQAASGKRPENGNRLGSAGTLIRPDRHGPFLRHGRSTNKPFTSEEPKLWFQFYIKPIYIYAFSRCFYPKWLTVHSGYTFFFCQYMCSLGIEPTTFALLTQCSNHWATGTLLLSFLLQS